MKTTILRTFLFFTVGAAATQVTSAQTTADEWREIGQRQKLERKFEDAVRSFSECIRLDRQKTDCYLGRGTAYSEGLKLYEPAVRDLTSIIKVKPDNYDAFLNRGRAFSDWGDRTSAFRDLTEAIKLKPNGPSAYLHRSILFCSLSMLREASQDHAKVKELGFEDAIVPCNLISPFKEDKWKKSQADRAIAQQKLTLGNQKMASGDIEDAHYNWNAAAKADPTFAAPQLKLAELFVDKLSRPLDAKPFVDRYRLLEPDDPAGALIGSKVEPAFAALLKLRADPKYAEAERLLEEADSLVKKATGEYQSGKPSATATSAEALAKVDGILKIATDANLRAKAFGIRGNVHLLRVLVAPDGGDAPTKASALTAFDEGIRADPKFVKNYLGRASLHEAMGNKQKALVDVKMALQLDPLSASDLSDAIERLSN